MTIESFRKVLEDDITAAVIACSDGLILYDNRAFVTMFGYSRLELIGQHINMCLPEASRDKHIVHMADWLMHPRARPMGEELNIQGRNKNGQLVDVFVQLAPIETELGILALARLTPRPALRTKKE